MNKKKKKRVFANNGTQDKLNVNILGTLIFYLNSK